MADICGPLESFTRFEKASKEKPAYLCVNFDEDKVDRLDLVSNLICAGDICCSLESVFCSSFLSISSSLCFSKGGEVDWDWGLEWSLGEGWEGYKS